MNNGYRLTPEEESIMRGEIPGQKHENKNRNMNHNPSVPKSKATRALLPVLLALGMMIGIVYFAVFLINGNTDPDKLSNTENTVRIVVTPEQEALFKEKLPLKEGESAAFWPLYIRFCTEMAEAEKSHSEWSKKQYENPENTLPFDEFIEDYTAVYNHLKNITLRFSEAFAALLGEERAPTVFTLHEEWQGRKK